MEQLFYSIQQHIATNMSVLSTIDEDYGQLQTDEDTYPVTFPCVLINAEQTDWESGPLVRKKSRNYSLPGGIKVYEMRYEVTVTE